MRSFALSSLTRNPAGTIARILSLAAAVGLLGALLLFVGHSLRTMTGSAVRGVPLDWQAPEGSYPAAVRAARGVRTQPGILEAVPAATAPFDGIEHRSAAGTIRAGAGAILAVPPEYRTHIGAIRLLRGKLTSTGVVLDQQLAATLQAEPGDTVLIRPRRAVAAQPFRVSGIALVAAGDVLFQPLIPLLGPSPAQPPANVAILPLGAFIARVAPALPGVSTANPASAEPGTLAGVQWQVQAQVDPRTLTGSPANALRRATQLRNHVESALPGRVQFVDNLSEGLTSAAGDALYAETLYIMLVVPGALVALGLAYLAALGTADRDRRELALLRARGARRRDLLSLAAGESAVVGVAAGAVGIAAALLAVHLSGSAGAAGAARVAAAFGICTALAAAGALAARLYIARAVFGATVAESRRSLRRTGTPLWQKLYLDVIALIVAGLVYWLTERTGFSAVVNPDSNPTLSLSVYMFLAPAALWVGATLLLVRLRGRALGWVAARAAPARTTSWARFLLVSVGRRGPAINRGLVVVGLLLAFGVELSLFSATYDQQARVDAQLTLGADIVVSAPANGGAVAGKLAATPGVRALSGVDHSYAYVGPDLQDTFGIDPLTIRRATGVRNSYFVGGGTGQMLGRLRARPDGILVSRETITDYSLALGDLLRLRVYDHRTGRFRVAPFHVTGIVQEFPAAPRDSFMVANLAYLDRVTHAPGANLYFVKAAGDPVVVARRISERTRSLGTTVRDIRHQTAQTVSSITTVSLSGIARIEEAFALVLAAAAMALFTVVALVERRQELATMEALGASVRRVSSFLWSEAAVVAAAALALAALLGWLLAEMLVAMLRHVFDPPPDHLAAPWGYLALLGGAAVGGTIVSAAVAALAVRRSRIGELLREE